MAQSRWLLTDAVQARCARWRSAVGAACAVGLPEVGGAQGVVAVTGLIGVAEAGGVVAHRAGGGLVVKGALRSVARAELVDVTGPLGGPTHVALGQETIHRAVASTVAVLGRIAQPHGRPALGVRGCKGTAYLAAAEGRAVVAAVIADLFALYHTVATLRLLAVVIAAGGQCQH